MVAETQENVINPADHLGLVATIVAKYVNPQPGQKLEDFEEFSDGTQGLYRAIERFDPARGNRFSTFAYWCIRDFVIKGRRNRRQRGSHRIYTMSNESLEPILKRHDSQRDERQHRARMDIDTLLAKVASDKNRRIVVGWYLEGKQLKELSKELGISLEAIRQRRERTMTFLQQLAN